MSQQDKPSRSSTPRPRSAAGARRRPGLPPERKRGTPPWVFLLLAVVGVLAIVFAVAFEGDPEENLEPVPLYVKVVGSGDIKLPNVSVDFHPKSDPETVAHEATTDERGVAILPKDKATGVFFVVARGMDGTIGMSQVREGDRELALLELLPAEEVVGEVVDFQGKAIVGATVAARFRLPQSPVLAETKTDENGMFRFAKLSAGLHALLFNVQADGYAWQSVEWSRKSLDELSISMPRTVELQVKVLGSDGKPVEGIRATLRDQKGRKSISDNLGVLSFPGLVAKQPVLLQIEDPERTYRFRGDLEPRRKPYEVVLEEPATLEGIVVDDNKTPINGVTIRHRHGPRAWVQASTGPDGRFRIGDLPSGEVWLEYELPDERTKRFTVKMARGATRSGYILRVPR